MRSDARPADDAEVEEMTRLMDVCFDDGSVGMSTGLIYPPGSDATTSELVTLCRTIARREKLYATHVRSEADRLLEAIDEALFLAKETGVRVHISHLKAAGISNWGKVTEALAAMEQARSRGCDVTCDGYPYSAGSTTLAALLPPWATSGGAHSLRARLAEQGARAQIAEDLLREQTAWDNLYSCVGPKSISIAMCPTRPELEGQSLDDVSRRLLMPPIEALLDLLMEDPEGVLVVLHEMAEDDVKKVVCHPLCAICSDGDIRTPSRDERLHPRTYGAFTRALVGVRDGDYPISLEEMIRKMTSLPASRIRMRNRGAIQQGMSADLAIFSLEELHERCSYDSPNQCASGMRFVVVNGQMVLDDEELTEARPGRVIR